MKISYTLKRTAIVGVILGFVQNMIKKPVMEYIEYVGIIPSLLVVALIIAGSWYVQQNLLPNEFHPFKEKDRKKTNVTVDEEPQVNQGSEIVTSRNSERSSDVSQAVDPFDQLFSRFDVDRSNTLNVWELGALLNSLGYSFSPKAVEIIVNREGTRKSLSKQELRRFLDKLKNFKMLFDATDLDGDGKLTAVEISIVLRTLGIHLDMAALLMLIEEFDEDHSNTIELNEFYELVTVLICSVALFQVADRDKNGTLDLTEFVDLLTAMNIGTKQQIQSFYEILGKGKPLELSKFVLLIMTLLRK